MVQATRSAALAGMSVWSISSTTHVRHASQSLGVVLVRPLSRKYDDKVGGRVTYTVSVCRRIFRPGLEARTQPTDYLDGNRLSHGAMYPM